MYTPKNSLIFQEPANEANHELILQYCTLVWCMGCYTEDANDMKCQNLVGACLYNQQQHISA